MAKEKKVKVEKEAIYNSPIDVAEVTAEPIVAGGEKARPKEYVKGKGRYIGQETV